MGQLAELACWSVAAPFCTQTRSTLIIPHQSSKECCGNHVVFSGIGKGEGDLGQLAKMASRSEPAQRWRRAKALVIDEVFVLPLPASKKECHSLKCDYCQEEEQESMPLDGIAGFSVSNLQCSNSCKCLMTLSVWPPVGPNSQLQDL